MTVSLSEITALIGSYFWPFVRVGAMVMAAPIYGTLSVPVRIRLLIAIALTAVVVPVAPTMAAVDPLGASGLLIIFNQLLIGIAMGFALRLVFSALESGGQIIGQLMGLGFAQMVDPQSGVQVPVVSQLYTVLATLIFLSFNGHLIMVEVLVNSFKTLPVAETGLGADSIWALVMWGSWIFSGAVLIAIPAVSALLLVNLAFAVMTRSSPQLNVFAIGFPITLIVGFVVIAATLPNLSPQFLFLVEQSLELINQMVGR
ncbi:MAG: flagellar biosynthetic protein FliR [Gammaproteobacteria bacterium]|nr:flagellar biosynthetic protein FliR [Gammaproteobacteria bacterium]